MIQACWMFWSTYTLYSSCRATAFHVKKTNTQVDEGVTIKAEPDENNVLMDDKDQHQVEYWKKVEDGVQCWIDAITCQRLVANEYFNNPPTLIDQGAFYILFMFLYDNFT